MRHIFRSPDTIITTAVTPIALMLLFVYVFGGALQQSTGTDNYVNYLLPGILGQTMVFTCFVVAGGLTTDLEKGVIDRFRSLPISRASVLIGRSIASLLHSSIGIVVMCLTGLAIGWRIRTNPVDAVLGFLVLLMFGFAMIWFGILVGCMMQSIEAVNGLMFASVFPLTFLSNAFVPTEGMVPFLRVIAEWNPVSSLVQSMRVLWGNDMPLRPGAPWSLEHPVLATVIWSVALTAVWGPLAVRAFNRRTVD